MTMKRVSGCASTTLSARPGPRTAICERLVHRVLVRQATDALGEVQASPSVVEYCHSRAVYGRAWEIANSSLSAEGFWLIVCLQ